MNEGRSERSEKGAPAPPRGLLGLVRRWVRDHASDGSQGDRRPEPAGNQPETGTPEPGGTDPRDPDVVAALAAFPGATVVRCPQCGGTAWRPNLAGDGEYCAACSCVSPLTTSAREPGEEG
jgi:hypothetical protein